MQRTRWIPALVFGMIFSVLGTPASRADDPGTNALTVGMVKGMFRDVQPALLKVLSRPFQELMFSKSGYSGDVAILSDAYALADAMQQKKCDLGVFYGFEYAWVKREHPDLVPLVVTVPTGRTIQAVVVVHKESEIQTLTDIGNGSVVMPRGTKSHCLAYLDKLRTGLKSDAAKPKTLVSKTAEDVLNSVVICEECAALVETTALSGYKVLHPGAFKQLRILNESEQFPLSVIAYKKGSLTPEAVAKLKEGLLEAHRAPAGKPLLLLWNLKGFEEAPADYDAQLEEISKAYPPAPRTATAQSGRK
ncbi:MAG: phosphate/phosphite/phosphonate ABC transporter substrate-binding protein [Bacteroidales bacterium]|nr:phosphate/phosphite/phosphonate ABC transporter substrate-binding protein [Bacteroidales bacterium]